jgi:hypothetical protein
MSQMHDLPPIAGAIIWARQIERQLLTYMKRVEDVLGKGWELYAEIGYGITNFAATQMYQPPLTVSHDGPRLPT